MEILPVSRCYHGPRDLTTYRTRIAIREKKGPQHHIKPILLRTYSQLGRNELDWTRASLLLLPLPPCFSLAPRIAMGFAISVYRKLLGSRWVTGRAP